MIVNMLFPAFLGFLILAPFLGLVFNFLKGAGHPASGLHTAGVFLFVYYLSGLWWMTGIGPLQPLAPRLVLVPFADMIQGPVDTALNVVLFVPLGFFLPWLWRTFDGLKQTALTGFLLSLGIELLQVFGLGITDINDLITNTLGTILGYGLFCLVQHLMKPETRKKWQMGSLAGAPSVILLILSSLFVMMRLQRPFLRFLLSLAGF
ncbi:VanZ family protein [Faecalibaculum rodentium]|jgi:glycopeptide antibiotics resistance protein|uniref:VanZ family protein n=2 Tax=Faecalibaculum rodentium TaxID=1702221 RepID=UPI0023F21404|nr:VanZ family protein [Faecalibaculum rodentium]